MSAHFIVLEGIDGAGTTTQAQLLCEELRRRNKDREVLQTREPWDGAITKRIRTWLAEDSPPWEALLHAFVLDRHVHLREYVQPALERGAIVVCDRYKLSTLVYQTRHHERALVEQLCASSLDPDLYLLLDVDTSVAAARMASRSVAKDAYERSLSLQESVAQAYRKEITTVASNGVRCAHLHTGTRTIVEVNALVVEAVCAHLPL